MTRGQKIAVITSSILVSVVVGGILYLYFNRKSSLKKLIEGEKIKFKTKEPKLEKHSSNEYMARLSDSEKSDSGKALILYQDDEMVGKYWMVGDEPKFIYSKETEQAYIDDNKELKLVKYFLENE